MAKFKIECVKTTIYTFEVEAHDKDGALEVAHDVLLGGNGHEGALALVQPEGIHVQCDVPERDWYVTEAELTAPAGAKFFKKGTNTEAVTYNDIENLGENYFDVSIFVDNEEEAVEHFCSFGSVWDIVDTIDGTCDELGYSVEEVAVNVGYDHVCDLVYGFHPAGPNDFEIVCDSDSYERLVRELRESA